VAADTNAQRLAELAALVDAVKERVRAQYPEATGPSDSTGVICVGLPDLTPLARARDAAAGKMAAIGTVNPRQGGLVNNGIQSVKRAVARALNWFVRDQVLFNRQVITCIEACIETIADVNRTIHTLAGQCNTQVQAVRAEAEPLRAEARVLRGKTSELVDLASHWHRWREEWQLKLHKNEVEFLKSVADLNMAVQQKIMHLETTWQQRAALNDRRGEELLQQQISALDAAYQKTARELEAACQQTAARIDSESRAAISALERGFRETVLAQANDFRATITDTEASFERRATQVEQAAAEALRQQHDKFEQLTNTNAATITQSTASQIEALAGESRAATSAIEERTARQAREFEQLLTRSIADLQKQYYGDLDRIRAEYERVIHAELRVVRQRLASGVPAAPAASSAAPAPVAALPFDYARFAERFRGPESYVAEAQRFYVPFFAGRRHVLDLGCGRGEFLKLMQEAGVPAKGIEASEESVAYCRSIGLDASTADVYAYLGDQAEASLDGIFCSQVVEHLQPDRLSELIRLCATRLATGGVLAIETPNPECLAIFGTHFYLDPTHTRPVPSQLLAFYMEEFGMGRIEVHRRAEAAESMPEVGELPEGFRKKFFDGLDYAIIAYKL
jgi:O-antigen chain-terminating methyltransferase